MAGMGETPPRVAVILPCLNEGPAIADVVASFRKSLPDAAIHVFDNNSTDNTIDEARAAGALVHRISDQGKGHVLRHAFAQIDSDVYVMADGDGTYDAAMAPRLVGALWERQLDMVIGTRQADRPAASFRGGHLTGNHLFNKLVQRLFGNKFTDIFSGYRALSRPFVKSFPALAGGFEIETEMCLHAIQLGLACEEIQTPYGARAPGSESKLKTVRDGASILWFILRLLSHLRPLFLAMILASLIALVSFGIGIPVVLDYIHTGLVPRLPTAVAAASLMIIATMGLATGIVLDGVAYTQLETKRLAYLAVNRRAPRDQPPPQPTGT